MDDEKSINVLAFENTNRKVQSSFNVLQNDGWDLMHSNAEVMSIYFSSMAMTVVLLLMVLQCTSRFYCFQQLLQPPLRRVGLALIFIFVALIISITHTKNSDGSQIVSYKSLIPQVIANKTQDLLCHEMVVLT